MNKIETSFLIVLFILQGCGHDRYSINYQIIDSGELQFYPEFYSGKPDLPSPAQDASGREVVLVRFGDNLYTCFDATVENGEPFDYKRRLLGKGNQFLADEKDFPAFTLRGIHSDEELANTKTITGRSVSQITHFTYNPE